MFMDVEIAQSVSVFQCAWTGLIRKISCYL